MYLENFQLTVCVWSFAVLLDQDEFESGLRGGDIQIWTLAVSPCLNIQGVSKLDRQTLGPGR